jgi:hypothetical protein
MLAHRFRSLVGTAVVLLGVGLTTAVPASAARHSRHHPVHHHHVRHHRSVHHGIPQHNGGDHDPDNNGGPSDGDGNL